ncbi:MAG: response regulator [Candidatus Alcyoniella australis]|nr:response regulator [Candidatus Alcyoniella australis]
MPRILVIEDNQDNREIICEFLGSYGFETIVAVNGEEGIEQFNKSKPSLALIDVLLPKVNGLKVCETIKNSAQGEQTPVIMMSALYKTPGLQLEAKTKYGADDYLIKPLDLMNLVNRICSLLKLDKDKLLENAKAKEEGAKAGPPRAIPPLPIKGSTAQFSALDCLLWMHNSALTGTYVQTQRNVHRTVYVLEGYPVYVASNLLSETLGKILLANGKISDEDLTRASTTAKQSNSPLSSILRKLGMLDANEITKALLSETHQRLINTIGWFDGEYQISEDSSWIEKIKRPKVPLEQLVYESIKRHYSHERISAALKPALSLSVEKIPEKLDMVPLIQWDIEELETFALINGERNLGKIQQMSSQPASESMRTIFTLFKLGIVIFI